ncbi:MAG TPA: transglycosylase domain-containing protein, partial [Xanthomonadaceae bacterium]|nr:transglycosylase domain-containing protein [Xanthomonadaceae bacterium]
MARLDYDEDDYDDDASGPGWRRRLLTWTLALAALGLGFLLPYMLYLNHEVGGRFGALRWQLPTRVYARPLQLSPGVAMDAQTLKTELNSAGYRDDGAGVRPGTYALKSGHWLIASRGYHDVDRAIAPKRIDVALANGRVVSVRDAARKQGLAAARLDPARIATLYGQKQEERRLVRIEEVPDLLVTGLQAVEDRDFSRHHGIDVSGILRALMVNA